MQTNKSIRLPLLRQFRADRQLDKSIACSGEVYFETGADQLIAQFFCEEQSIFLFLSYSDAVPGIFAPVPRVQADVPHGAARTASTGHEQRPQRGLGI